MVLLRTSPVNGCLKMGPCPLSWPHPFELAFCVGLMFFQTCRAEAEQVWASWDSRSWGLVTVPYPSPESLKLASPKLGFCPNWTSPTNTNSTGYNLAEYLGLMFKSNKIPKNYTCQPSSCHSWDQIEENNWNLLQSVSAYHLHLATVPTMVQRFLRPGGFQSGLEAANP